MWPAVDTGSAQSPKVLSLASAHEYQFLVEPARRVHSISVFFRFFLEFSRLLMRIPEKFWKISGKFWKFGTIQNYLKNIRKYVGSDVKCSKFSPATRFG